MKAVHVWCFYLKVHQRPHIYLLAFVRQLLAAITAGFHIDIALDEGRHGLQVLLGAPPRLTAMAMPLIAAMWRGRHHDTQVPRAIGVRHLAADLRSVTSSPKWSDAKEGSDSFSVDSTGYRRPSCT